MHVVVVPFRKTAAQLAARLISLARKLRTALRTLFGRSDGRGATGSLGRGLAPSAPSTAQRLRGKVESLRLPSSRDPQPFWSSFSRFSEVLDQAAWAWRAYRAAVKLDRQDPGAFDLVIVSSPPHWTQLAGLLIQRRLGIPYVADMRDPWVTAKPRDVVESSLWSRVNLWLEHRVLRRADLVIFNTGAAQRLSQASFGDDGARPGMHSVAIGNGYDSAPFDPSSVDFQKFRVVFAGFIYPHMDVRVLFRAFASFVQAQGLDADRASLELIGAGTSFNGFPFAEIARAYGIGPFFELSARVSRDVALQRQAQAAVLVAMDYPYPSAIVMKAYDYLCMPGFILALTHAGSALSGMLDELGLDWFGFDDEDRITAFLDTCFRRWQGRDMQPDKDPGRLHAREKRSAEIAVALEQLLARDDA